METKWGLTPKHFNDMFLFLQVKGFLCLPGEMVVWHRSWVCQHKDFCHNVLSLNVGLQGPLGISLCFLSSGVSFILSCISREPLKYPQVSLLTEVLPSVCFLEHLLVCLLIFFCPKTSPYVSPASVAAAVTHACECWGAVGGSSGHVGVFVHVLELAETGME